MKPELPSTPTGEHRRVGSRRPRVALLVNLVAPYRLPVYRRLSRRFDLYVLCSGREGNRSTWPTHVDRRDADHSLFIRQSWGVTIPYRAIHKGRVYDVKYLHLTLGYWGDLIRLQPDAVISIEMGPRTLTALAWGALFRRPVVVWWGGTRWTERDAGMARRLVRSAIARLTRHWISYGSTSTDYLQSIGVRRERILQIQNCVDEEIFQQKVEPSLCLEPRPVLLYVGQMIQRKGVDRLLEAAARLQAEGLTFSLLLVGDGPERETLVAYAKHLGLDHVTFHPAQPNAAMPAIYRSADVLVFPTNEDVWGLVVNEALWSGIPVICSTRAGCAPEIVPVENHFDPDNPDDFARALRRAAHGELAPPDVSPLWPSARVADAISDWILQILPSGGC